MTHSSLWWRVATSLALTTASAVLALAVLEVVLRVTARPSARPVKGAIPPPGARVLRTIPDLLTPNVDGVIVDAMGTPTPYRTNRSGMRGRDYDRPKPGSVFRIAVLGDSITMGVGVREEDTYAARIERTLNESPSGTTYEVLNLGIAGFNASATVDRLENVGMSYDPDLIIYGYTLNDIEGPHYRRAPGRKRMGDPNPEQWPRGELYVATFFRTHFYSLRELVWPPSNSYVRELDDNYFDNQAALAAVDSAFGRLQAIIRGRGTCVLVLQHTHLFFLHAFHPFQRHHAVVARLVAAHGFTNKDTLEYFRGRSALELWVAPIDPHPNGEGHAILTRAAFDGLRELPARCWGSLGVPLSLPAASHASVAR